MNEEDDIFYNYFFLIFVEKSDVKLCYNKFGSC